eukprot:10357146-Alexandrium_andersonii.AAC.1
MALLKSRSARRSRSLGSGASGFKYSTTSDIGLVANADMLAMFRRKVEAPARLRRFFQASQSFLSSPKHSASSFGSLESRRANSPGHEHVCQDMLCAR